MIWAAFHEARPIFQLVASAAIFMDRGETDLEGVRVLGVLLNRLHVCRELAMIA
jgi:hypothetical protein